MVQALAEVIEGVGFYRRTGSFCGDINPVCMCVGLLSAVFVCLQLITEQFKDMPLDVVFTGGDYPLAVALKLFEEIDQSTTVVLHHRLSHDALKALSQLYRQVVLVLPDEMDPDATLVSPATHA